MKSQGIHHWLLAAMLATAPAAVLMTGCPGETGPDGPTGPTGAPGPQGDPGEDGDPGTDGEDGAPGADGEDGDPGADGQTGQDGAPGADGTDGAPGTDGEDGEDGEDGGNVEITNFHGTDHMLSTGEYATAGKYFATATITSADAVVDGTVTVEFTVDDADGDPAPGITGMDFNVATLYPPATGESFNRWVDYNWRTATVSGNGFPNPDGTEVPQAYRENGGVFTDHGDGSYTYVFDTNISNVVIPVTNEAITYDRSYLHRVSVQIGGHSGPTAEANYDWVPDGSQATQSRDIVQTEACISCHGPEFHGHGGDRLTLEGCNVCHTKGSLDAESNNSIDMKVMLHKIHAGGELASIPGDDGIVWDDPDTLEDESADNGSYGIYGYGGSFHEWWNAEFPAVIENCTKCHQGAGADVDNWKEVPSRETCGSCHDDVDFANAVNHTQQLNDDNCGVCHPADGLGAIGGSVEEAHNWTEHDPRNIPEFDVDITVSTPSNGDFFEAGEMPVVSVVLNDAVTGVPIDHTTVVFDDDGDEGCVEAGCPPGDGKFEKAYIFVNGPRGRRNPVLTTMARVEVVSDGAGPFDISAADATLEIDIDGGLDIWTEDEIFYGMLSIEVADGTFVDESAATAQEIVDWLNDDDGFFYRAEASLNGAGEVVIRSRNLGDFFSLQLIDSEVTDMVFDGNTDVAYVGGYYPSVSILQHTDPADDDPAVSWAANAITVQLDDVADLQPGTYVVSCEIAENGSIDDDYLTPSVTVTTFQVGEADEEPMVAEGCGSCHWGPDDTGFVLDPLRHNKMFTDGAVDQCGACHDYQSGHADGEEWYGGKPINKRVHAVHFGAELNYPLITVDHSDEVAGRDWAIHFPQDVRHCESCHPDTSSGSWMTNASRLPCAGCHDSQDAMTHMKLQTWDPTPADPWSGDEEESCTVCH